MSSDIDFAAAVAARDPRAVERLFATHGDAVARYITHLAPPRDDAELEEAVTRTFVAAMHRMPRYRNDISLKAFMLQAAHDTVTTMRRDGPVCRRPARSADPRVNAARHALLALPVDLGRMLTLKHVARVSNSDIAGVMGHTHAETPSLLKRAAGALRCILGG